METVSKWHFCQELQFHILSTLQLMCFGTSPQAMCYAQPQPILSSLLPVLRLAGRYTMIVSLSVLSLKPLIAFILLSSTHPLNVNVGTAPSSEPKKICDKTWRFPWTTPANDNVSLTAPFSGHLWCKIQNLIRKRYLPLAPLFVFIYFPLFLWGIGTFRLFALFPFSVIFNPLFAAFLVGSWFDFLSGTIQF